jgi:uncharacterized protein YjbJ (UPF0337 family)
MGDQDLKGAVDAIEGRGKEVTGRLTGDRTLEAKGKTQRLAGKVRDGLRDIHDAIDKGGHG